VADAAVMPRPPFVLQGYSPREASSMGTVAYDDIAVRALEPLTNIHGVLDAEEPLGIRLPFDGAPSVVEVSKQNSFPQLSHKILMCFTPFRLEPLCRLVCSLSFPMES